MAFNIVISPLAAKEIDASIFYYNSRKTGLGFEFLVYLKGYLSILKRNPELFPLKRKNIFREIAMTKFPFVIIYEIVNEDVVIYSVFHTSRNPADKP